MKVNLAHRTRIFLVRFAKSLPFLLCSLLFLLYLEYICSLITHDYALYDDSITLNTPIGWFVAKYFEYNVYTIIIAVILSFAMETCIYNKLACLYLGINLLEKIYFDFVIEPNYIFFICIGNIIVTGFLTFKGISILRKK